MSTRRLAMPRHLFSRTKAKFMLGMPPPWKNVLAISAFGSIVGIMICLQYSPSITGRENESQSTESTDTHVLDMLPLVYSNKGKRTFDSSLEFSVGRNSLVRLGLPPKRFTTLTKENVGNIVIVTGASQNHFWEVLDVVAGAQEFFPNLPIVFVDYGLNYQQAAIVRSWCQVTYKKFDFSKYPKHVRNMWYYAWKILTFQWLLGEYPDQGVLWLDASVRFSHGNLSLPFSMAMANGGMVHLCDPALTIFSLTHPKLYEYFPTDKEEARKMDMVQAGALLVYNTRAVYEGVLYWAYLCALEKDCISPTDALFCHFEGKDWHREWVGCHRYDQSVFNILESNFHNFNTSVYDSFSRNPMLSIVRGPTNFHQLRFCNSGDTKLNSLQSIHWLGNPILAV